MNMTNAWLSRLTLEELEQTRDQLLTANPEAVRDTLDKVNRFIEQKKKVSERHMEKQK